LAMGNACNGSKKKEIAQSEERPRVGVTPEQKPRGVTPTKPIESGGASSPSNDDVTLGTSYSEQRQGESDFLRNLVERTAQNLIDVSQTNAPLKDSVVKERSQDYSHQLEKSTTSRIVHSLFSLPSPSQSNPTPAILLGGEVFTHKEKEMLNKCGEALAAAIAKMGIRECGQLVVPFGSQ